MDIRKIFQNNIIPQNIWIYHPCIRKCFPWNGHFGSWTWLKALITLIPDDACDVRPTTHDSGSDHASTIPSLNRSCQTVAIECGVCLAHVLTVFLPLKGWFVLCIQRVHITHNQWEAPLCKKRTVSAVTCILPMLYSLDHLMTIFENCEEYDHSL